ncbi:MAG: hypothetical protein M3Y41_02510 [Pseudomonadota bacterium]|nr:hypothetical protein [Pseudomonadota bacterium]
MTAQQKSKRRNHHVWQHYLKPWTTDGAISCLQEGRTYSTGTSTLAVEKDFYKLDNLTRRDTELITTLFANGHPLAKRNHAQLLNMLMAPFQIAGQVKHPQDRAKIDWLLDDYASNVLEDYHASIETSFIPALENALNGDLKAPLIAVGR